MNIKIKRLREDARLPEYAHDGDAGMDVFSCEDVEIKPGERKLISTGLGFELPDGFEIQVRPKSGLSLKHGIMNLNTPGTLDPGYRGELKVILYNSDNEKYNIKKGDKIAQLVLARFETAEIEEVDELNDSERGEGGFGSTGYS